MKLYKLGARVFVILIALGLLSNIVGIRYPVYIENQPLKSPVRVINIDENKLFIADGRIVEIKDKPISVWEKFLIRSDYMIDIEPRNGNLVSIYSSRPRLICGTPYSQPIRIPIIKDPVNKNQRQLVAVGCLTSVDGSQQDAPPDTKGRAALGVR